MLNNIEDLYELVLGYKCNMPDIDCSRDCVKCSDYIPNHFTAARQLELIKWLSTNLIGHFFSYNISTRIGSDIGNYCVGFGACSSYHHDFSQALAGLTIKLWASLTDTEKQEIRRIIS
jgi:hypothetical protein